jgi:hypothetical protein
VPLSHVLVYAPSIHSHPALFSKIWLEITQDFINMLYKHVHSFLYQLMVNHDGVFRLHRTNTKFIPDNRTTPVILFADTQSCIPSLLSEWSSQSLLQTSLGTKTLLTELSNF